MGVANKKPKSYLARFWVLIVAVAILLLAGTLAILYFGQGYRIVSYQFETEGNDEITKIYAVVRVDAKGDMFSGTAWCSDGTEFTLKRLSDEYYKVAYDNGDVYYGGLESLQKSGTGRMQLANGDVYEGTFSYDVPWGEGEYRYFNGDVYTGSFYHGKKSGEGVYTWAEVEGEVQRKYEGGFSNDMRNGYGVYYYANGSVYQGFFLNDLKSDTNGTLLIKNKDGTEDIYVGGFAKDVKEGYGEYRWSSGAVYAGDFSGDVMEGQGTYTWPDGIHSYQGTFQNNKPYIESEGEESD
ncbi:MAG: hypothetical protein E7616_00430 [Ruminococcaceae bacterium]|nr:hypothetical protein [Oscillospiraceae bacterium]